MAAFVDKVSQHKGLPSTISAESAPLHFICHRGHILSFSENVRYNCKEWVSINLNNITSGLTQLLSFFILFSYLFIFSWLLLDLFTECAPTFFLVFDKSEYCLMVVHKLTWDCIFFLDLSCGLAAENCYRFIEIS